MRCGCCLGVRLAILLPIQLSVLVNADYELKLKLGTYSNPDHKRGSGRNCDTGSHCDNIFKFEVDVGRGWEQQKQTGTYWNEDDITFGERLTGGLDNPLVFTTRQWQNDVSIATEQCLH